MDDILSDSPQTTNETNFVETMNETNLQETTNETNFVETTNETNIVETIIHIPIKNVLFVNSAVLSLNAYTNSETYEIGYNFTFSTADLLECFKNLISLNNNNINRIGFAFHYSGDDDDHEPFFTDSDLGESVETFSPNMQFMLDLLSLPGITHVDFLACNTLQSEKWRLFYQLLRLKTGVVIGASDDNTGNMKLGGDWIMESTHEEVGQIYFTSAIENWASLLLIPSILNSYYHTFYTFNSTDLNAGTVMTRTIYDNAGTIQDTQDISYGGINVIDALSLMDGGGINPYAIGIVDSARNQICMDIAFCGLYTKALTSAQQRRLMTYANTTLKEPHTYMRNNFTVTVSGGVYWIATDGGVAVSKPQLQLTSGNVYAFDQSHASNAGFPLRFTLHAGFTTPTAYANDNLVSTPYDAWVVISGTPGSFNSSVIISVDASTPQPLYYYCTNPGALMGYIPSNVIQLSKTVVYSGSSFYATFFSSLNTGTDVSYSISGCVPADLSLVSLNGKFTSPYQTNRYVVANSGVLGKTITFNVSGGTEVKIIIPTVIYTISYVANAPVIKDVNLNVVTQPMTLTAASIYLFYQTEISNRGPQPILLSSSRSSFTAIAGTTTTFNGTPGYIYTNAYTMVQTTTAVATAYIYPGIYYMSVITDSLGNRVFAVATAGQIGPFYTQLDLSFGAGASFTFDVSHPTITQNNYTLLFGTTRNGSTANETYVTRNDTKKQVYLTIPTTYSGANFYYYSADTATNTNTVSSYIPGATQETIMYNSVGVYCISVETNSAGNLVFAVSTAGQSGSFNTQLDLSFGAGTFITFDVSHPSIANRYTLLFGTTRDGTADETYVTRTTDTVVLYIPLSYTGANIYYYSNINTVSSAYIAGVLPQSFTYKTGTYYVAVQKNTLVTDNNVFALSTDGVAGPFYNRINLTFTAGTYMTFNVSHASMAGYTFAIGSIPDGTPDTSLYSYNASTGDIVLYIPFTYSGSTCYYFEPTRAGMGYNPFISDYYMSVVTNNVGNLVFAVSTAGQTGPYKTQLSLTFGTGSFYIFDLSHPSIISGGYVLRFGTTPNGTPDETVVTREGNRVFLAIPTTYTGENMYYYSINPFVSAYITPVITMRGQPLNNTLTTGLLTGIPASDISHSLSPTVVNTTFYNAGIGMAGITSTGKTLAFAIHNNFSSLGIMFDYSDISASWTKSTTTNNKTAIQYANATQYASAYHFDPFFDTRATKTTTDQGYGTTTGFNWPNHNYFLNDTGTMCVITGHNDYILRSGGWQPGAFAVYEISNNIWRLRGNTTFFRGHTESGRLGFTFDTDATFNTLVAGSSNTNFTNADIDNGGNYIKIYTYNFTTLTYDNPISIQGALRSDFGNIVRMNSTGTKIIAVASKATGGYAKIYTSTDNWTSIATINTIDLKFGGISLTTSTNIFIPYTQMSASSRNISKALDVYLTVDSSNTTNVFTLNTSTGIATRRNIIPECSFYVTKPAGYTYVACLSGDGNRIFFIGGASEVQYKMSIYDYNTTTNTWSQTGLVIGNLLGGIFPSHSKMSIPSVSMTYDGSTIAIGDIFSGNTTINAKGNYHILKCVTPQTFY